MSTIAAPSLEDRVARVEHELAILQRLVSATAPRADWLERMSGSFKDDPDFGEILRLGREFRQTDAPKGAAKND